MKTVTVRDLQKTVKECMDTSQDEKVVVTRHGRPTAVIIGVEGEDWEDVVLKSSNEFWKMVQERRKAKTIPLEEIDKKYGRKRRKKSTAK